MDLINEVGTNTIPGLKELDKLYLSLKKCKSKSEFLTVNKQLETHLQFIFGPKFKIIIDYGVYSDDFAVLPILTENNNTIVLTPEKIDLGTVKYIYLFIGKNIISFLTARELTAVTLHEIGHVIQHTSRFTYSFMKIASNFSILLSDLFLLFKNVPIIRTIAIPIAITTSRTLYWTNHIGEYNADKFAVQYGYGDELLKAIHKWKTQDDKMKAPKISNNLDVFSKLLKQFKLSTHPKDETRIQNIVNQLTTDYCNQYDNKALKPILQHYIDSK